MLLKFKNKHLMALDKMIKEAKETEGMIDSIILDTTEALGLFLELSKLGTKYLTNITMHDRDGNDIMREKLLWGAPDIHDRIKDIIQCWYKTEYEVKYRDIKLVVVKPKAEENTKLGGWMNSEPEMPALPLKATAAASVPIKETQIPPRPPPPAPPPARSATGKPPEPPKPPLGRILTEGVLATCRKCDSSMKKKWFFFDGGGCIQPECENYWEKNKR